MPAIGLPAIGLHSETNSGITWDIFSEITAFF